MNFRSPIFALTAVLTVGGCSLLPQAPHPAKADKLNQPAMVAPTAIVTPDFSLAAKVVTVNEIGRFVVLTFTASGMPKLGQTLFLYHAGLKTAEVRVTGPQSDNNIVADIVSGDTQIGDTVSDK